MYVCICMVWFVYWRCAVTPQNISYIWSVHLSLIEYVPKLLLLNTDDFIYASRSNVCKYVYIDNCIVYVIEQERCYLFYKNVFTQHIFVHQNGLHAYY